MSAPRVGALVAELEARRGDFLVALARLPKDLVDAAVIGDWDARDIVVHVAFWSDHGADALELARAGRGADFAYDKAQTDAINARVAASAHGMPIETALDRESAAFDRFRSELGSLGDELLEELLGNGDAIEDVVRYDGPDHYAEHAAHLQVAGLAGR